MSSPAGKINAAPSAILPVPTQAPVILTPASSAPPSALALELLSTQCMKILESSETYSVATASPGAAGEDPARSRNHFYSQSPHWWQMADGIWEWRDAQRNPVADAIDCQNQLQKMAVAVQTLALGYQHLRDPSLKDACFSKVGQLLQTFFLDDDTRMLPEVEYSQCNPSQHPMKGNESFVISTRYLILAAQAVSVLPDSDPTCQCVIKWFGSHIDWMRISPQGQQAAKLDKKMSRWYHAAVSQVAPMSVDVKLTGKARLVSVHQSGHRLRVSCEHNDTQADGGAPTAIREAIRADPTAQAGSKPEASSGMGIGAALILASLTVPPLGNRIPSSQGQNDSSTPPRSSTSRPADDILTWLESCVRFVEQVQPGAIEVLADSDERQEVNVSFFKRQLLRWRTGQADEVEVDNSLWADGWTDWSKLAWALI